MRNILRKDIVLIVVPCPRCGSWYTDPLDKQHKEWRCQHMNCLHTFQLAKHYALIFLKNGEVIRVDKDNKVKVSKEERL